jgi:8-oxo-dGTP pyrophosphatase MutT (NUDIX family)
MSPGPSRIHHVFHHSAGAVVVDHDRCLVVRRDQEWMFPKGHLEQHEEPEQAAVREVVEETGIEIAIDSALGMTSFEFRSDNGMRNRKRVDWFLAHPIGGDLRRPPGFSDVTFVTLAKAASLLTHDDDRALLERAVEVSQSSAAVDNVSNG